MAEAPTYYYESEIEWQSEKRGDLRSAGLPTIGVGAPPEFSGHEGVWSPEQLLVASFNSCYMLTFLAVAEFSKVSVVSFSATAKGKLAKVAGTTYQITEIVVKPTVVVASANELARLPRLLEKAKENCFISNSIKASVKIEPQIYHRQIPASPCAVGEASESSVESAEDVKN